ncbi:MAG: hypothetical protein Q8T09_11130 [Candidatus Melainabacteria bacterium]|nr:hypothetical protein [Candidatus Melainabacteria bacterium]
MNRNELAEAKSDRAVQNNDNRNFESDNGLGSLSLCDLKNISRKTDCFPSDKVSYRELVFGDVPVFTNQENSSRRNDKFELAVPREILMASDRGVATFNATQEIYNNALQQMVRDGHHIAGGDFQSSIGNILQNSGLSKKTWVCAEQAEFLARQLRNDPRLTDSKVFLIHTPGYEHLFVGVKDPDGKMIYLDPWREKGPARTSPNKIEGMQEFR